MKNNIKKILMIINEFPPTGESGVQRPLKYVKYLVRAGYKVFVVTPIKPTKDIRDHSLLKEIPEEVEIIRTGSWGFTGKGTGSIASLRYNITGNQSFLKKVIWKCLKTFNDIVFPIDKQIGWVPFAYRAAMRAIKRHNIRNVYITGFPFSAFIVGLMLKRRFKSEIFWLVDYRDAWQFEPKFEEQINGYRQMIIRRVERHVLKSADYFCFATEFIRKQYCNAFPGINSISKTITNGYDEDDFSGLSAHSYKKFTFLYMGKIYPFKRSPIPLLKTLKKLQQQSVDFDFSFTHIGTVPQEILDFVTVNKINFYAFLGYKSHREALEYALGADILVMIVNNDPKSKGVLTGKLFELVRLNRPLLALGPRDSLLEKFITKNNFGVYAFCDDETEILNGIETIINMKDQPISSQKIITSYSRENLTRQLIECFET